MNEEITDKVTREEITCKMESLDWRHQMVQDVLELSMWIDRSIHKDWSNLLQERIGDRALAQMPEKFDHRAIMFLLLDHMIWVQSAFREGYIPYNKEGWWKKTKRFFCKLFCTKIADPTFSAMDTEQKLLREQCQTMAEELEHIKFLLTNVSYIKRDDDE